MRAEVLAKRMQEGRTAKEKAWQKAAKAGMRTKGRRNGTYFELVGFENGGPLYYQTYNENAAISSAANLVISTPYSLSGAGIVVGVWDAGSVKATHQEFGGEDSRVVRMSSEPNNPHSTHVAGTIAAQGIQAQAKGMAPAAEVWSYHMGAYGLNDYTQMSVVAADSPNNPGQIFLSNHSYGFSCGWVWYGDPCDPESIAEWVGGYYCGSYPCPISTSPDEKFGRYGPVAASWDAVCYSHPYYLPFKAAGNDRDDPAPQPGQSFFRWEGSGLNIYQSWYVYDPYVHPPADGAWLGGYDTIPDVSTAKNIVTVGAVDDAVTGFTRDLSKATMPEFGAWGPTDDGRIKPDIVANGVSLYSPGWNNAFEPNDPGYVPESNTSYCNLSGTSMACPSAAGSAAILIQLYRQLFPSQAMLGSTLKALIIHTADDLGNAGPDYQYGWGLMNTKAAADLIIAHHAQPLALKIFESDLGGPSDTHNYTFIWDGQSDVKVTLCWTDLAGSSTLSLNDPSPRLIRDMDIRILDANGVIGLPFVLDRTHPNWAATTGDNYVDNVEQIIVPASSMHSVFTVRVSMKQGTNPGKQRYSLIITGQQSMPHPSLIKGRIIDSETSQGVPGVTLSGEPNGLSATTDSQGYYEIMVPYNWAASPSTGQIIPAKYSYSFEPNAIDYNDVKMDIYNQNYVAHVIRPVISGTIRGNDSLPASGVRITTDPNIGTTFSDPNGMYSLVVPYGYSGALAPDMSSMRFSPESRDYVNVTSSIDNQDFIAEGIFHRISGRVTGPGDRGLAGVSIVLDPNNGETLTDSQGYYYIDVMEHFSGVIEPHKYGYVLVPPSRSYVDVTAPATDQDYAVDAIFYDGFDDNTKSAAWIINNEEPNSLLLLEEDGRLNILMAEPNGHSVFYKSNWWKMDPNQPFTMKVGFHLDVHDVGEPNNAWLTFKIADNAGDYISISAGCEGSSRYYSFSAMIDGNTYSAQTDRNRDNGTLYITGDPAGNAIHVSYREYGPAKAWQTLLCSINGCVGRDVTIYLGGGGYGASLDYGQAWLDNFEIDTGTRRGWPPVTDIDQDGFIGWGDIWRIASHWLENYQPADINKDGKIDFRDYALVVAGW